MCVTFIHKSTDFNRIFRSECVYLIAFKHNFRYFLELFSKKCQQIENFAFINFKWNVEENVFIRTNKIDFFSIQFQLNDS